MKKILVGATLSALILTGCDMTAPEPSPEPVADCDAGDLLEGDSDCGGVEIKAPTVRPGTRAPLIRPPKRR